MHGLVNISANRFSDWGELSLVEGHNVCWGGGGEGRGSALKTSDYRGGGIECKVSEYVIFESGLPDKGIYFNRYFFKN